MKEQEKLEVAEQQVEAEEKLEEEYGRREEG